MSVSMLFYFMFWKKPNGVPAIKDKDDAPTASKSTPVPAPASTASKSVPASAPKKVVESDVIVEDAEDDDEEEEEEVEGGWDAELEELKTKYEDANRLSSKYIQGQKYEKAIEKLTEAIELAPKVPSGGKDIMTLYNNRSAMYEKLNTFDKSLADISVILAMEPLHIKARVRKARIHEAQVC